MPNIDISVGLHNSAITNMMQLNNYGLIGAANYDSRFYGGRWAGSNAYVALMQGTRASSIANSQDVFWSNILVYWPFSVNNANLIRSMYFSTLSNNILTMKSYYSSAIRTGTATWFLWFWSWTETSAATDGLMSSGYLSQGMITGTVGGLGSGADLEMTGVGSTGPVNIVSGQYYKMENLQFTFPRTFTY